MTFGGTTYASATYGGTSVDPVSAIKTIELNGEVATTRPLKGDIYDA